MCVITRVAGSPRVRWHLRQMAIICRSAIIVHIRTDFAWNYSWSYDLETRWACTYFQVLNSFLHLFCRMYCSSVYVFVCMFCNLVKYNLTFCFIWHCALLCSCRIEFIWRGCRLQGFSMYKCHWKLIDGFTNFGRVRIKQLIALE